METGDYMKLIVGLGNPGKEYEDTRHNAGFKFIDEYAKSKGLTFNQNKFKGLYTTFINNGEKIILLKPQKYMNLSGEVVRDFVKFFKIKIKYKGSSGGHNGLKNIEQNLNTNEYKRIKIGISNDKNEDRINYVIGKMPKEDLNKLNEVTSRSPEILEDYLNLKFDNLMNKYNTK